MVVSYKTLAKKQIKEIEREVKMLLHSSRDSLRTRGDDTTQIAFWVKDDYYAEAFGIMRGLKLLGYGYFGSENIPDDFQDHLNLKWWFNRLEQEVLEEENWGDSNLCDYCFEKFGRDAVRER